MLAETESSGKLDKVIWIDIDSSFCAIEPLAFGHIIVHAQQRRAASAQYTANLLKVVNGIRFKKMCEYGSGKNDIALSILAGKDHFRGGQYAIRVIFPGVQIKPVKLCLSLPVWN